jgi:hypothetical protein
MNISRGFFRIWIVLSLGWVLGVAMINPFWKFGCNQVVNCLLDAWEEANLQTVPMILPPNQKGLTVYDLTSAQQRFMELPTKYLAYNNDYQKLLCELPRESGDEAEFKKYCYNTWWYSDPKRIRYKLTPIDHLVGNEKEFIEGSIEDAAKELHHIVLVTFGIPLAVGAIGFALIYAGRWIPAGFLPRSP